MTLFEFHFFGLSEFRQILGHLYLSPYPSYFSETRFNENEKLDYFGVGWTFLAERGSFFGYDFDFEVQKLKNFNDRRLR